MRHHPALHGCVHPGAMTWFGAWLQSRAPCLIVVPVSAASRAQHKAGRATKQRKQEPDHAKHRARQDVCLRPSKAQLSSARSKTHMSSEDSSGSEPRAVAMAVRSTTRKAAAGRPAAKRSPGRPPKAAAAPPATKAKKPVAKKAVAKKPAAKPVKATRATKATKPVRATKVAKAAKPVAKKPVAKKATAKAAAAAPARRGRPPGSGTRVAKATAGRKPAGTRAVVKKPGRPAKAATGRLPAVKAKPAKVAKKTAAPKAKKIVKVSNGAPRGAGARKEAAAALAASMPVVKAKRGRKPKVPTLPADTAPIETSFHEMPEAEFTE
jgi:hypothetical protein